MCTGEQGNIEGTQDEQDPQNLLAAEFLSDMPTHSRTMPGWCGDEWDVSMRV